MTIRVIYGESESLTQHTGKDALRAAALAYVGEQLSFQPDGPVAEKELRAAIDQQEVDDIGPSYRSESKFEIP